MPELVDTHAHLDMPDFDTYRDEVIARAIAAGVTRIITVGTDTRSSRQAVALTERYHEVYAAVGVHPHDAAAFDASQILVLRELATHPRVVALGEMGLDFYRNRSPHDVQYTVLRAQLDLAAEMKVPVIIHSRQATEETIAELTAWSKRGHTPEYRPHGVIHCFSDGAQAARQYVALGFYLSFPGFVSYPKSRAPEVARTVPLDRILVETDCPFLPSQAYRGKRNEPAYVALTAGVLAGALGMTLEAFARQTTENAERLFGLEARSHRA